MALAYVDTSCLVVVAFQEPGTAALRRRLERFEELFASDEPDLLRAVSWIVPDRPLGHEIARVLEAGYVRGADCWHLATALFLADDPTTLTFLTLDKRQRTVASALGFPA